MNILVLAPQPFFQHRGTPIAVKALTDVLVEHGHHVDILAYHVGEDVPIGPGTIHRIAAIPGIRNVRPGFSLQKVVCDLAMVWRCFGLVRRGHYDLIHAVEEAVFLAMAIRRVHGIPYVYDMDSSLPVQLLQARSWLRPVRPALEWMERVAVRGSVGVVAVCRSLEETARAYAPGTSVVRLEDVSLIPPGERYATNPSVPDERPVVMYVGNLEPYQGIDLLLESFQIAARETAARLVVVGGAPPDVSRYARRAVALGLSDLVEFVGARPIAELGAHLARSTVLVSPRIQGNNTPMKIYSYLDSGRPVLATRLSMHEEVLDESIAVLTDPSPDAMAAGMIALLRDPDLRARLAACARARVAAEFSPASFRSKLVEFYDSLPLARPGAARLAEPSADPPCAQASAAEKPGGPDRARTEAAMRLFQRSVLKQAKLREIACVIGRSDGMRCLDIGGDNGIISLLLRRLGGRWWSADLGKSSVRSIRDLVGGSVARIGGGGSPFRDGAFDLVVIVDFLEHTVTDREFLEDMRRILAPGGVLVIHVPQARPRALVNRLRNAVGLTDERHGHVRPGYSVESLRSILPGEFVIEEARTYSRVCSELIEALQSFAYDRVRRPETSAPGSLSKGPIITAHDAARHQNRFALLGVAYPVLRFLSWLDWLFVLDPGYRLIVKARLRSDATTRGDI